MSKQNIKYDKIILGENCPHCGGHIEWEPGHPGSYWEPEEPAQVYCDGCEEFDEETDIDWALFDFDSQSFTPRGSK